MALREHCDQCGDIIPLGIPSIHNIELEKAGARPAKLIHVNVTYLLQATHEKAHVCPACSVKNLSVVINNLKALIPKKT